MIPLPVSEPLNVLHIAPTPFFSDRGCHIRIRNEVAALEQVGARITVATYHHGRSPAGMNLQRIPAVPGYTQTTAGYSPYRFIADGFLLHLVVRILKKDPPDVIHAHLHEGALIGWAARQITSRLDIPLIMDMQGSLSGELAAYQSFGPFTALLHLFRVVEYWVCRLPDFIFCSSAASQELLHTNFGISPVTTQVIEDIIPEYFLTLPVEPVSCPGTHREGTPQTVIYTGSLLAGKGLALLLAAMDCVLRQCTGVNFILLGYPKEQAAKFISARGWRDRCQLPGKVPYDQLSQWLNQAHVALEPKPEASGEASGKLIHYLAAGLPVACFATPNNYELLGPQGYYAKGNRAQDLAQAMLEALDDDQATRRGLACRSRIANRFSPSKIAGRMMEIYQRLLGAASRKGAAC